LPGLKMRRTYVAALAVLVAAFVALYPYLGEMGFCGSGGCPEVSHSSHAPPAGYWAACLVAVLVASPAAPLAAASFSRRRAADHPRPTEPCLSPETPPPRASF
jgi:hypothetical protein